MWHRTGENLVYVRQQKAAEEQLRFDKTEKPSRLASKDSGGNVSLCPPRRCNLVGLGSSLSRGTVSQEINNAGVNSGCGCGKVRNLDYQMRVSERRTRRRYQRRLRQHAWNCIIPTLYSAA